MEKLTASLTLDATSTPAVPRTQAFHYSEAKGDVLDSGGYKNNLPGSLPSSAMRPGARMKMHQMDIPEGTYVGQAKHRSSARIGLYRENVNIRHSVREEECLEHISNAS